VEGKKKRKEKDPSYAPTGKSSAPSSYDSDVQMDDYEDDNEESWPLIDKDGDYTFCYYCLDLQGIELFICDECKKAVHFDCCKKQDDLLNRKMSLSRDPKASWRCHYCEGLTGVKHGDPIAAFLKLVNRSKPDNPKEKRNLKRKKPEAADKPDKSQPATGKKRRTDRSK